MGHLQHSAVHRGGATGALPAPAATGSPLKALSHMRRVRVRWLWKPRAC